MNFIAANRQKTIIKIYGGKNTYKHKTEHLKKRDFLWKKKNSGRTWPVPVKSLAYEYRDRFLYTVEVQKSEIYLHDHKTRHFCVSGCYTKT